MEQYEKIKSLGRKTMKYLKRHKVVSKIEAFQTSLYKTNLAAVTYVIQCSCGKQFECLTEEMAKDMMSKHLKEKNE